MTRFCEYFDFGTGTTALVMGKCVPHEAAHIVSVFVCLLFWHWGSNASIATTEAKYCSH